ncbi:MAG TPA: amidohydrolase family protein, partial [Burkholderiales bacterium]|nr:amidohydrolase family protein [Burkholderiales bacterium]
MGVRFRMLVLFWAGALLVTGALAASAPADVILHNGNVITVDAFFSIREAVAIRGERVIAVGRNADIDKLAGPSTRRVDLQGKTVIPGLIDNHAHFMRAVEYWPQEVRWDGVTSRKQALAMIAERAKQAQPGEWILVLGGWSLEQFTDSQAEFTRDELDRLAPNNPVLLQLIYFRIYTNTAGLKALGVDMNSKDPPGGRIERTSAGELTGVMNGGGAVRVALAKLGEVSREKMLSNARLIMRDLNRIGITAYQDQGGRGFTPRYFEPMRELAQKRELTVRVFYNLWQEPESPAEVDLALANLNTLMPFQGDDWFDNTGYGETVYFPLHDS